MKTETGIDSMIENLRKGLLKVLEDGSIASIYDHTTQHGLCFGIAQRVRGSRVYDFMEEFMCSAEGVEYPRLYIEDTLGLTPTRMNIVFALA